MSTLAISLLGGFEVFLDGRPIAAFGTDKARALLAFLAVEARRPHRRAALAAMLWPELPEDRASHNLRQALLLLRRALGEADAASRQSQPFLLLGRQEIQLNPLGSYRLDVADFLELARAAGQHGHLNTTGCSTCIGWLRQAADLFRGDLLHGFSLRDSVPFDEWQLVQQEFLHGQALEVLTLLADHYERRGETAQVLEYARRLVALEPWHERGQMQVIAALAQSGQEAAALDQYASYSRILSQEFGASPSKQVTALCERIRIGLSAAEADSRTPRPAAGAPQASVIRAAQIAATSVADERRQVTVLACRRQWGSSADPEEWHEQLARCREQCAPILARLGGHLQPRQGSDCLAYFGYPVAQEDAARRAVSAGLAMTGAARGTDLLRIGIHTGIMVTGPGGLLGGVPDLARDCMLLAAPGSVVISADTERIVRGWFDSRAIASAGPVAPGLPSVVLGARSEASRLEWLAERQRLTPLAGRQTELQQLMASIDGVRQGHGQVITLHGEPGIGKSRLVWELKQRTAGDVRWLEAGCSPYFQNTNLYPVVSLLEQLLGFSQDDDPHSKRHKLAAALAEAGRDEPAAVWLLSLLLNLPTDTPATEAMTQGQRERIREESLGLIERETRKHPLLLVIEDLHWADPTTLSWIGRSLDGLAGVCCAVVLTWRSSFTPSWPTTARRGPVRALTLELGPLSPQQTAGMVAGIAAGGTLTDETRDQVVRQTDGIPLYIEELTRTLFDATSHPATSAQAGTVLPSTLRDSLTAHLDGTGAAKETAQWASTLGRGFSYALLAAVVPYNEQRLKSDLEVLRESRLIYPENVAGRPGYAFRHALIQEAAYGMLLKRARLEYHRRIAEVMVARFPQITEGQPEVLAYHYSQAGMAALAADQWTRAGERAAALGATEEARTFFGRALGEIGPREHERRWRALLGREDVLNLRGEREPQRADIEALIAIADTLDDDVRRVRANERLTSYSARVADHQLGLRAAEAACEAAFRTGDPALELVALTEKVQALCNLTDLHAARRPVEQALAKLSAVDDEAVKAYALGLLSMYYSHVGDFSRALRLLLVYVEMARRMGERAHLSRALANVGLHYSQLGMYAEARTAHEEGLALAAGIGDRITQTMQRWNLAYVMWCLGNPVQGRAYGEGALQELRAGGQSPHAVATTLGHLGLIAEDTGDLTTASSYLAEACALYVETAFTGPRMELQAAQARCMLHLGRPQEAAALAAEVWEHILTHGLVMFDYPSRVFACIADVMSVVEAPRIPEREVLDMGYRELMRSAEMIEDSDWRRSFLEAETSNRQLLARLHGLQLAATVVAQVTTG